MLQQIAYHFTISLIVPCILLICLKDISAELVFPPQMKNDTNINAINKSTNPTETEESETQTLSMIFYSSQSVSSKEPKSSAEPAETFPASFGSTSTSATSQTIDQEQSIYPSTQTQSVSTSDETTQKFETSRYITFTSTSPTNHTSNINSIFADQFNSTRDSSSELSTDFSTSRYLTIDGETSKSAAWSVSSTKSSTSNAIEITGESDNHNHTNSLTASEIQYTTLNTDSGTTTSNFTPTSTTLPITTTTELMVTANSSICPVVIVTPQFISKDFGSSTSFTGIIESNSMVTIKSRWVKIGRDRTEIIDVTTNKYSGSANWPKLPKLMINSITFDDEVNYQLQVQMIEGWCLSNTVNLQVRGILQFNDTCNMTKECDESYSLECSPKYNACMCTGNSYHKNNTCFPRTNLRAVYRTSAIMTSYITVWWNHPHLDSDLIQSYTLKLREYWWSFHLAESVGRDTTYTFQSNFTPGYLYYFSITSVALLSNPTEMINVTSSSIPLVVEPLPPGPIDKNASDFHPEKLYLRWAVPQNKTYVDRYRVIVTGAGYYSGYYSYSNAISWSNKLEPGKCYNVTISARSWHGNYFAKESARYVEQIETLRTPKVEVSQTNFNKPFLSTLEIRASVKNLSNFPPTDEVKWQRIRSGITTNIDITETRYNGSTVDFFDPILVINKIDFYNEDGSYFQCVALNAEGWGTSNRAYVSLYGSLDFLEQCNQSRECKPNMHLTCRSQTCLCSSSYYHKNSKCYSRSNLVPPIQIVEGSRCGSTVKWRHPYNDAQLVDGFQVLLYSLQNYYWHRYLEENVYVGNITEYATLCKYQPGRAYEWIIRAKVSLSNPTETIYVGANSPIVILDLYPAGKIDRRVSNFSANNLYLRWEKAGHNTFLNYYVVTINGYQQQTYGSFPEIYWTKSLTPGSMYNVTIIAVSFGFSSSGPWYGTKKSEPYLDWIEIDQYNEDAYIYMAYGERDEVLRGDDVTTPHLKSPTTMYVGDGSEGGFNYIVIGTNGIIGLGEEFNSITIHDINTAKVKDRRIICPFWTDLLTVDSAGNVYYKTYQRGLDAENDLFLRKANEIIRMQFGDFPDFEATWLVKVTWENMTLFGDKSQKVTFQNLLITDGLSTFTVINYIDVNLKPIQKKKITIGYQYKKVFRKNSFSNKNAAFRMSKNPGNRGARGFWIYKMTTGIPPNKDERECYEWYTQNKEQDTYTQLFPVLNLIECPCDSRLLRFDPRYAISRFDRTNRVLCYASMTIGRNAECCYRMHGSIDNLSTLERFIPAAGTILVHNPFFERQLYSKSDLKPKEACCKSGHCHWYYEVRPIPRCYVRSPFQPGINFGDPHILTLDGKNYTFNGFGEYTMMKISNGSRQFDFQARTELATAANGTTINATVFSAFVAQDHTGSKVQIDMTRDKKKMIIRVNENDLTRDFENVNHTFLTQNISVRWENQTISASFLQSSIILKVSLGVRFLISETVVDNTYKGYTRGLMGNFDGDLNNEFILPNGTMLDENATKAERDIYYNFGQLWLVGEGSLFYYGKGLTYKNFSHLDFEPLFLDETNEEKLNEAKKRCGPNPSQACIFDYLATGDIALAESSGTEETVSKSDIRLIENETPSISGNTSIHAEVGQSVELWFTHIDDGKQRPKYNILKQPDDFFFNQSNGIATWTPRNLNMSEISISVEDELGAESPTLDVSIVLCGGCMYGGYCDYENVIPTENVRFSQAVCICKIGYSGDRCETDTDACDNEPCPLGRECFDLTPEQEIILHRGYNCSECPPGFEDVENKCEDVDECENGSISVCNPTSEKCENTEGSFVCNCITGYRKENNTCIDIDECDAETSGCESICQNTPGSFICRCHPGFSLNDDNTTCSKTDEDLCKEFNITCEYTCNTTTGKCICPIGYEPHENGKNCTDIDECSAQPSLCQQNCININGSFMCSCSPGYTLKEDKTSCTECEEPNYGENCSQLCECGPGMDTCDPISGCVCMSGWTGRNCTEDINECKTNSTICRFEEVCENLEGSYQCNCKEGFQRNKSSCEDIDECTELSYSCPESKDCLNLFGNYTCACKEGFQEIDSFCKDVDECDSGNHDCSQLCVNTIGGYNCECELGFELHNDRRGCEKILDMCKLFPDLNCSYGCAIKEEESKTNKGICFCESGFELEHDNSTCKDIDECKLPAICEHNCTNKRGSFECGCSTGYTLQNDGKSCRVCIDGRYGEDCLKDCQCGRGSERCDHVKGCVCRQGWSGELCDIDINECNSSSSPCLEDSEVCINTVGSYRCECKKGYENLTNGCLDINECFLLSPCDHNCTNTNGSYYCTCDIGYELVNSSKCSDINECQNYTCHNCSNLPGGFNCSCSEGYSLNMTTFSCHNINECDNDIYNCADNAICIDTDGGYNCSCWEGFEGNGETCYVCKNFTFGVQCSESCQCVHNNTVVCNHVNGSCQCKKGWNGHDCSQDVNECEDGLLVCNDTLHQVCFNSEGSAACECQYGGLNISDCNTPIPPQNESDGETKVKVEVEFDVNYNKEDVMENSEIWIEHAELMLNDFYKLTIPGFTRVIVLSIRFGSIITDQEIFANMTASDTLKKDIANGLMKLARQEANLTLFNESVEVKNVVLRHPNGTYDKNINSSSSPCSIFDPNEYCTGAETCSDTTGVAVCVVIQETAVLPDWTIYFIAIGVCVPLIITMIALLIICVCHQRKSKDSDTKRIQRHMIHNDYDLPKHTKDGFSNEYCTIDSNGENYYPFTNDDCRNPSFNHNPMYDVLKPPEPFRIKRPNVRKNN